MPPAAAEQRQAFPPPPSFYRLYRVDVSAERPLPPKPPAPLQGEFTQFGEIHTTETGIPPLRVRQLYETRGDGTVDFQGQLSALLRELRVAFLELLTVLIDAPSTYARQVESVGLILRNMQYLLNLLRPVQARAALESALRQRIQRQKQGLRALRSQMAGVDGALEEAARELAQLWANGSAAGEAGDAGPADAAEAMAIDGPGQAAS